MEQLSETLRGITVYMNHGEFCHQIYTNVNGEVQIEECPELISNQEEADTRLLLHAKHASHRYSNVIIRSPGTDVFILLLGHKPAIPAAIYFDTGVGNQRRVIDVNKTYSSLGSELCDALIGFHAFTGNTYSSSKFSPQN